MKKCPKCGVEKCEQEFYFKSGKISGYCKPCELEKNRNWRKANPQKCRESTKKWRATQKGKLSVKKQSERRYKKHREKILVSCKEYRQRNRDKVSSYATRYYQKNKPHRKELSRKWKKDNPKTVALHASRRRKNCDSAKGYCDKKQLDGRFNYHGNRCYYCGCEGKMTLDHRIPFSRGGTNWPANIVPACKSCNCSKGDKTETEFLDWRKRNGIN